MYFGKNIKRYEVLLKNILKFVNKQKCTNK